MLNALIYHALIIPTDILVILVNQRAPVKILNSSSFRDVEDLIHNFLIIMLEHSMRQKDGWKVIVTWCGVSVV